MNRKIYSFLLGVGALMSFYSLPSYGGNNQSKNEERDTPPTEIEVKGTPLSPYKSHDLAFHDLYGNVKECIFINNDWGGFNNRTTYSFNKNGEWTNIPDFEEYEKSSWPELQGHKRYEKNIKGYIETEWLTSDMEGIEKTSYEWMDERPSKRIGGGYAGVISYLYDDNGLMVSKKIKYSDELEDSQFSYVIYSYSDHQFDDHKNWVKRKVTKLEQMIDDFGDNSSLETTFYEERELSYFD